MGSASVNRSRFTSQRVYPSQSEVGVELFSIFREASIAALLSIVVSILPAAAGFSYLLAPSERRLALLRPVSLAGLFSGLAGLMLGLINVLKGIWIHDPVDWKVIAVGAAESLVPLTLAFGALTFAWLCVALGMRRGAGS